MCSFNLTYLNESDCYAKLQLLYLHSNNMNSLKSFMGKKVKTINLIVIHTTNKVSIQSANSHCCINFSLKTKIANFHKISCRFLIIQKVHTPDLVQR